jgi:phosphoribosyl-ATP pyrophosphohydrolase
MTMSEIITKLESVIRERLETAPAGAGSYVSKLAGAGIGAIGAKISEEAEELIEAAGESGEGAHAHLVHETADLVFHTLVMLGVKRVAWNEIERELARRFGTSGIAEKESRGA